MPYLCLYIYIYIYCETCGLITSKQLGEAEVSVIKCREKDGLSEILGESSEPYTIRRHQQHEARVKMSWQTLQ